MAIICVFLPTYIGYGYTGTCYTIFQCRFLTCAKIHNWQVSKLLVPARKLCPKKSLIFFAKATKLKNRKLKNPLLFAVVRIRRANSAEWIIDEVNGEASAQKKNLCCLRVDSFCQEAKNKNWNERVFITITIFFL